MSPPVVAISRFDVADYVHTLITLYIVLIFIRILLSYFQRIPYNRFLRAFVTFVTDVTEPFLRLFRRFIPPARIGPAAIDLSPIVATFALIILRAVLVGLIRGG